MAVGSSGEAEQRRLQQHRGPLTPTLAELTELRALRAQRSSAEQLGAVDDERLDDF